MNDNINAQSGETQGKRDPFGRMLPDDGSQSRFRDMNDALKLEAPIGPNGKNSPDDVARIEIVMDQLGELDLAATDGPTGFYGERLRQAIIAVQQRYNLPETGRVAPNDATMAAIRRTLNGGSTGDTSHSPLLDGNI